MDNMASKFLFVLMAILPLASCFLESGKGEFTMNQNNTLIGVAKSLYNFTEIIVKVSTTDNVRVDWVLRWTPCTEEYSRIDNLLPLYNHPDQDLTDMGYTEVRYQKSALQTFTKEEDYLVLQDESCKKEFFIIHTNKVGTMQVPDEDGNLPKQTDNDSSDEDNWLAGSEEEGSAYWTTSATNVDSLETDSGEQDDTPNSVETKKGKPTSTTTTAATTTTTKATTTTTKATTTTTTPPPTTTTKADADNETRRKREAPKENKDARKETSIATCSEQDVKNMQKKNGTVHHRVTRTWQDGIYIFMLHIVSAENAKFSANVAIEFKLVNGGYLSALEWPLLPFYGVMCAVYIIYGIAWLIMLAMNWRDLLRIQFWIGAVIFLGMLEKAVFFAEYESYNTSGKSALSGALIFAELVSCLKRSLARMLVVIVSLGYGIVKPRLGAMLHRVVGMGALFFIISGVEGILRVLEAKTSNSKQNMLAGIPLAVLDAAICYWVFTSLLETTRTLRLRRNVVKLSLYRHFTNALIFAVLASVAFMVWVIAQYKLVTCITGWKELWFQDAFWHLLFCVILLVIMILWRPTANNQRYAFSPLLDGADDGADEPMMNDAYEGMKNRKVGSEGTQMIHKDSKMRAEEDLKWIEENIPATVADNALPSLLDSDEEIMTTRFEMGKMD